MAPISKLVELAARGLDTKSTFAPPFQSSSFTLDSSGVAGFFGGDGAVQAMATVHLFEGRRWFGWYNTPGSYEIAKQYGQLANSRLWDGLFPGPNRDPAQLFGLDGRAGPPFLAAHSGSYIQRSGHLAHLIACKVQSKSVETYVPSRRRPGVSDCTVAIIDFRGEGPPLEMTPPRRKSRLPLIALVPISASVAACVLCALVADWWCFVSIAYGILASGIACFVIGSAELTFRHPAPAKGAPPGDGVLLDEGSGGVIVLRGKEGAVNALTRGRYYLNFDFEDPPDLEGAGGEPRYARIGACSVLLTIQFLLQLLFIPQGTLFGQILFVVTLGVSWSYNAYLSALEKEGIQTEILLDVLNLRERVDVQKLAFGTRTAMAVFTCLALRSPRPMKLLDTLLPNDTPVWKRWKEVIVHRLLNERALRFGEEDWKLAEFGLEGQALLQDLFVDAEDAYEGWYKAACHSEAASEYKEQGGSS
ncbi:hypothetical protein BN946_scf184979.g66 [Trametes cinnabarina]|uniref:Uncharacterized protein n=1 Tax=Pycnoporus cinnabarinus TaxID=5643 RepID=A0A060SJZ1_PYCCI|nr:hypothetical protein BN946_scf184979.g66 [Trametes cinnabarina]